MGQVTPAAVPASRGTTLDDTYELTGDTLRVWAGKRDSPAYFPGSFDDDDSVMDSAWVYPGGDAATLAEWTV